MAEEEVYSKIEHILNEILPEFEDHEDGDFFVDWIVVGYVANPDSDKTSGVRVISSNELPGYRIIGLLHSALIRIDPRSDNDEED